MVGEEDVEAQLLLLAFPVDKEEAERIANRVPVASLVIMVEAVDLLVEVANQVDTRPKKHPVLARNVPMGGTKICHNKEPARNQVTEDIVIIQHTKNGAKLENTQMHNRKVANHAQVDGKE